MAPGRFWEAIVSTAECLPREIFPACCHAAGRVIDRELVIIDLKGFGSVLTERHYFKLSTTFYRLTKFWQMKDLVRDSFNMSQNYYPET